MITRFPLVLAPIVLILFPELTVAQEIGRADAALNASVADFVTNVTTDTTSAFYQYTRAMIVGFAFIGFAWHVMQWATKSIHVQDLALYAFSVILVFIFWANYNTAISTFWSWSDGLAAAIQTEAVGTPDLIFVGSRLQEAMLNFFIEDYSIFDGFGPIFTILTFKFITLLLEVVIFIVSMWHVWGYAFVKVTGLIFIPLLLLPITRGFFDAWFKILLGFWFFNLFAKITLSIYYIYFFAIFGALSDPIEFDPVGDRLALTKMNFHFLMGIVFLLASGGFASMMASGFGSFTSSASGAGRAVAGLVQRAISAAL